MYMTAVDTGWCSDERPHSQASHEHRQGFSVPLTCADGAARAVLPHYAKNLARPKNRTFNLRTTGNKIL